MSYKDVNILLNQDAKRNTSQPQNKWLVYIEKEIALIKSSWREQRIKQLKENLYSGQSLDQGVFDQFVLTVRYSLSSQANDKLSEILKNQQITVDERVAELLNLACDNDYFDAPFIKLMPHVLKLFAKDQELFDFLRFPQKFINEQARLTSYDKQCLEFVVNDPTMKHLQIAAYINIGSDAATELTKTMKTLNLKNYGCRDALRFEGCINPLVKEEVLENAQKTYYGPIIIGMAGALPNYTRTLIASTSKKVVQTKMGECHTFAQLAADRLLEQIEKGQLNIALKMVVHQAQLGSHTFLLVNHTGELNDLSHCLIIDPWAYVMGYSGTEGIFTLDNYPYLSMTTQLQCCYDSFNPSEEYEKAVSVGWAAKPSTNLYPIRIKSLVLEIENYH